MRKLKTALLLLLAAAVVLGCGALPGIAAALADRANLNVPASAPMNAVSLIPTAPATNTLEYYLDRLALHGNMYSIPVNEDAALMTSEEALSAARTQLQLFYDLGLILPLGTEAVDVQPSLSIAIHDVENSAVFWSVNLYSIEEPYYSLLIQLDDTTGKIMELTYEAPGCIYAQEDPQAMAEQLAAVYLQQFAPENETLSWRLFDMYREEAGPGATSLLYVLSDFEENEYVHVRVILHEAGFQITCSADL